jgi:hypothetical protein
MRMLDAVLDVNGRLGERVDGELEALTGRVGQVLDLRDSEAPLATRPGPAHVRPEEVW